jgi:hypothetical protein
MARGRFVFFCYHHLIEYSAKAGLDITGSQDFFDYIKLITQTLNTPEALNLYQKIGGIIYRQVVDAGQTAYIPLGSWILERTIGSTNVIGFRTSILDGSRQPLLNFHNLSTAYEQVHGSDNACVKFWAKCKSLFGPDFAA